jgi:hydrogenase nickel incorporation protein HypA/HybF
MHELSIATGIVDEIVRIAEENRAKRVLAANLRIGRGAGIVIDSLRFALEVVKTAHPVLTSTEMRIDEVPLIYRCNDCGREFEADDLYLPRCPMCGSYNLRLVSGEEMDIKDIEIEV